LLKPDLLQSALETAADAIIISDPAGIIVFANRQVAALFGYQPAELAGSSIELLLRGRLGSGEPRGRRKDGSEFPVEISVSPIANTGLTTAAIRDVTVHKVIETALVAAREEAERANRAKSRFLATASHDLRQPLQTLALLNGALRRAVQDPYVVAALAHQDQAINAMSRLLGALLDISKLESGSVKLELTDFTVAALFEEMRGEFESTAAGKGLTLTIETEPLAVHSDRALVEQVLRNLLSNAIKYTREGSVRLRGTSRGSQAHVEVLDSGIGIPAGQIPYICDEFYQVGPAPDRARDGYGLGLSIVRRIVNLLNLELEIRSEIGKGSSFALTLPAGSPQALTSEPAPAPRRVEGHPRTGSARVLLVEDDAAVRDATRLLLRAENYAVTAVASLKEALAAADAGANFDVVVTDYHLGQGETGLQVVRLMRARLGESLRVVLVTGDTSSAMHDLPRDAYMRMVSKPVEADELLKLLHEVSAAGHA
jgi:signal transduction histidine kinase/ActR/RegA family two-component response regulator